MTQFLRCIINALPFKPSVNTLINITGRNILLPFYHTISDEKLPHISNLYPVRNINLFLHDLDFLLNHYHPVSIDELYKIVLSGRNPLKPVFHLTFDDGLKEFYTIVAPILEKKKIPATVFVNTAFIDNKDMFYRYQVSLIIDHIKTSVQSGLTTLSSLLNVPDKSKTAIIDKLKQLTHNEKNEILKISELLKLNFTEYLETQQPYMSSLQIENLIRRGFNIGSHGLSHPLFKLLKFEEQIFQVKESFKFLQEKFEIENRYFSFPFSDEGVGQDFFDWFQQREGYRLSFGISGFKDDSSRFHLHRIPMEGTLRPAATLIKAEYLYFILKSIVNKNQIART